MKQKLLKHNLGNKHKIGCFFGTPCSKVVQRIFFEDVPWEKTILRTTESKIKEHSLPIRVGNLRLWNSMQLSNTNTLCTYDHVIN